MRPSRDPATRRSPVTPSTPSRRPDPPLDAAPATLSTGGAPRPLGGDAGALAAPRVLPASWTAPTPPPAAERAPSACPIAPGGEAAIVAASLSSTMAVRAGCFLHSKKPGKTKCLLVRLVGHFDRSRGEVAVRGGGRNR